MTKDELIKQKEELKSEIERLQKIIDASSETTFDIITDDLKQQIIEAVENEEWSEVKSGIKEISAVNGTKDFISRQSVLITKKKEELEDIETQIKNFQPSLFEQDGKKPKK